MLFKLTTDGTNELWKDSTVADSLWVNFDLKSGDIVTV